MRRYGPDELRRFVVAVDANLSETVQVIAIGGSAVALGYGVEVVTKDLDLFEADLSRLEPSIARARQDTGLAIPVDRAAIAELPYQFVDRLRPAMNDELEHLEIFVPDPHDLALSKNVRGSQGDLDQLARLHDLHPLDRDTLVERFLQEMTHVIGNQRMHAFNLLDLIEHLWGELARQEATPRVLAKP